jgi:hypothetical protein
VAVAVQGVRVRRQRVELTDLGKRIVDPETHDGARAEAFLRVPLYRAIFDRYRGVKLPPRPWARVRDGGTRSEHKADGAGSAGPPTLCPVGRILSSGTRPARAAAYGGGCSITAFAAAAGGGSLSRYRLPKPAASHHRWLSEDVASLRRQVVGRRAESLAPRRPSELRVPVWRSTGDVQHFRRPQERRRATENVDQCACRRRGAAALLRVIHVPSST